MRLMGQGFKLAHGAGSQQQFGFADEFYDTDIFPDLGNSGCRRRNAPWREPYATHKILSYAPWASASTLALKAHPDSNQ